MRNFLISGIGAVALLLSATAFAAEPASELTPKEAVRLISMRSEVQANTIVISFILEGSAKTDGFEARHVRRVAAVLPVRGEVAQRRGLVFYDLFWNEALGWFLWEVRPERTGDAVYIWSELRGEIVNR